MRYREVAYCALQIESEVVLVFVAISGIESGLSLVFVAISRTIGIRQTDNFIFRLLKLGVMDIDVDCYVAPNGEFGNIS